MKTSAIRQTGESQNGRQRKQSTPNFPKNKLLLPLEVRNVCFAENPACLVFM